MYHERNDIKCRSYLGYCELEVDLRDGLGRVVGEGKEEADGARLGVGPVRQHVDLDAPVANEKLVLAWQRMRGFNG